MFKKYTPALLWMIFIFYLSSRHSAVSTDVYIITFAINKTLHLIEYAILVILFFYPLQKIKPSILYSLLFAVSDEIHQHFVPGRQGCVRDVFIDMLGILIGILIIHFWQKHRKDTILKL